MNRLTPSADTLFMTDTDVRNAFDWTAGVGALREAYAAPVAPEMFPARTMARGDAVWLRTLSGISPDGGVMGAKLIAASTRAKYASYLVPLFDQATTALIALLDGNAITGFRTAATSALAIDALAVDRPWRVAVIGSGFEAQNHVRALASLRTLQRVTVYSPNPASRVRFIEALADLALRIDDFDSAEAAITGADVVICAARSRDESPTLCGAWLRPGATIVSIGSTLPEQRELDVEAIERADLIVADMVDEVVHDTGDMIAAGKDGVDAKVVSLSDVVSGRHAGRTGADQIIIYKSVGAAIQDIAVAALCARRGIELGIGTPLPVSIVPVDKGK